MSQRPNPATREDCVAADERDPLAPFRNEFALPPDTLYFDGNSLGATPKAALARAQEVIAGEWATDLIGSWNKHHWFDLPSRIGDKIARLIGGGEGSCVATDGTSINLFKTLGAALRLQELDRPGRRTIISERGNFPTDLYVIGGLIETLNQGYQLRLIDAPDELESALDDTVAAVVLTEVNYRSGELWDMAGATKKIHDAGALAIWDLCHSAGALPIDLTGAGADFAIGCGYKYLNGGPGAPAFAWVAPRHLDRASQPLSGWWGDARPFEMDPAYQPAEGVRRFLCGSQPIISLAVLEVGVDLALRADMQAVREKSLALTSLFIELVETRLAAHGLGVLTPREDSRRGSQVALLHDDGFAIMQALIANGVIGDYREPAVLRFGFTPLYLRYTDVWDAVETLRRVLDNELWRAPQFTERGAVT